MLGDLGSIKVPYVADGCNKDYQIVEKNRVLEILDHHSWRNRIFKAIF